MSDDRLQAALRRLGAEELPDAADRAIRGRLETAWTTRPRRVSMPRMNLRRLAPVLPVFVLIAGFGGTALGATADSPFWDTRVAIESAAASLRLSKDDRVAYLLDLVQSRTEEAARQDAAGHPAAAAKARTAAAAAVVQLDGSIPRIDTTVVLPTATRSPVRSASPTASAASSPSPSPDRSASGVPAVQLPPSPSPTPTHTGAPTVVPTPTPLRTESLRPATPLPTRSPIPSPTAAKQAITIAGAVRDAAGANVTGACISTSSQIPTSTSGCIYKTTNGSYGFSATTTTGQTITLYASWTSPTGENFVGSTTGTLQAPTTVMPTVTLTLRK
jgi:hypothetical protein